MQRLLEIQRALAASLARGDSCPPGCEPEAVARAARALEAKRRRAAAHLLPNLRNALGESWRTSFHDHAAAYAPSAMLYHVDDAWELAERATRSRSPALSRAARQDLARLRRRYARIRRAGSDRIRERRGWLDVVREWFAQPRLPA